MEGGWFRSPEDSRKCLYQVIRSGHKWHVLELRVTDRCRHVIIRNGTAP
ncbi:conserved domain protein, partial [delta proteobacterium NaphS2]